MFKSSFVESEWVYPVQGWWYLWYHWWYLWCPSQHDCNLLVGAYSICQCNRQM